MASEKSRLSAVKITFCSAIGLDSRNLYGNTGRYAVFALLPRYIIETAIIVFIVGLTIAIVEFEGQREALIPTLGIFGVASLRILPLARNFRLS